MSNDLAMRDAPGLVKDTNDLARVSDMLAKSGFFKDARDAAQCGVKVLAGLEMGFGAFASMTGIHIIQGKPSVGAGLMAAAVKRHPKYDYRVKNLDDKSCTIAFYESGELVGEEPFTIEDAKRAGLLSNPTWKNYPRNMLFARAMSNGIRFYCPDVFDAPTYTPEELGAPVNEHGDVIDVEAKPAPKDAPRAPEKAQEAEERLSEDRAAAMHQALADVGLKDAQHFQLATLVLKRPVRALTDLTPTEAARVYKAARDGGAAFLDSDDISEDDPPFEFDQLESASEATA